MRMKMIRNNLYLYKFTIIFQIKNSEKLKNFVFLKKFKNERCTNYYYKYSLYR